MRKDLEVLVPSPALCEQLAPGEFEESALVWIADKTGAWQLLPRDQGEFTFLYADARACHPAPSLVEILRELPKERRGGLLTIQGGRIGYRVAAQWIEPPVPLENPQGDYLRELTNAAMRLFLRLAGENP